MSAHAIEYIITNYPKIVFSTLAVSVHATLLLVTVSAILPIAVNHDGLVSVTPSSLGPTLSMGLLRSCSQNDSSAPIICTRRTIPAQYDFTDLSAHVDTAALEAGTPNAGIATVICIGFGLSLLIFALATLVGFRYLAERETEKRVWDDPWMRVVAWIALLATVVSVIVLAHLYVMLHMVIEIFNGSQSKFIASHGTAWNQMVGGYVALATATIIYIATVYCSGTGEKDIHRETTRDALQDQVRVEAEGHSTMSIGTEQVHAYNGVDFFDRDNFPIFDDQGQINQRDPSRPNFVGSVDGSRLIAIVDNPDESIPLENGYTIRYPPDRRPPIAMNDYSTYLQTLTDPSLAVPNPISTSGHGGLSTTHSTMSYALSNGGSNIAIRNPSPTEGGSSQRPESEPDTEGSSGEQFHRRRSEGSEEIKRESEEIKQEPKETTEIPLMWLQAEGSRKRLPPASGTQLEEATTGSLDSRFDAVEGAEETGHSGNSGAHVSAVDVRSPEFNENQPQLRERDLNPDLQSPLSVVGKRGPGFEALQGTYLGEEVEKAQETEKTEEEPTRLLGDCFKEEETGIEEEPTRLGDCFENLGEETGIEEETVEGRMNRVENVNLTPQPVAITSAEGNAKAMKAVDSRENADSYQ